jgi:uncharacterized protein (TIGR03086 family)
MNESLIPLLKSAVDTVAPIVASVKTEDHGHATPCEEFDLKALTEHLIGGLRGFADVGEGKALRFDADPNLTAENAGAEFRLAADRLLSAFAQPAMDEKSFAMPWGESTGAQLMGFELIELLVHGWDIARSLDRDLVFDGDLTSAALAGARQWVDDSVRTPQMFGPEVAVPTDAPPLAQLVGFLGRHPDWKP